MVSAPDDFLLEFLRSNSADPQVVEGPASTLFVFPSSPPLSVSAIGGLIPFLKKMRILKDNADGDGEEAQPERRHRLLTTGVLVMIENPLLRVSA